MDKNLFINMKNEKVILASSSSSRKKILRKIGLCFCSTAPKIDEQKIKANLLKKNYSVKKITLELAKNKSKKISKKFKKSLVIGCDTMIELNKKPLNKARNLSEAKEKLKKISGKRHSIHSSIYITKNYKKIWQHTETSFVTIRKLGNKDIKKYLESCGRQVLQSVGCYQAEKRGPQIIKKIEGDFFNVLGLPVFPFISFIKKRYNKYIL